MEPKLSFAYSKEPATDTYLAADESSLHLLALSP
jgi:hypothetical protein